MGLAYYGGCAMLVRLVYANMLFKDGVFRFWFRKIMAVLLSAQLWVYFTWLAFLFLWMTFSALVDPAKNLALGIAIFAAFVAAKTVYSHLQKLHNDMRAQCFVRIDQLLRDNCIEHVKALDGTNCPHKGYSLPRLQLFVNQGCQDTLCAQSFG